ncbi:hypothetical protein [Streptomyces sp. NPDC052179]|uniref:hypothetical protein n=1 Tax=Streptomyces sp. NPDC052179 TaxID=3155680 RepID=UPI003428071B
MSRRGTAAADSGAGVGRSGAGAAVAVVIDVDDHPAWTAAALDAHCLSGGRIVLHPSPGASAPPALAQDLLHALGKQLPRADPATPRHRASWADLVTPAWTAAACWMHAHRVGHLVVLRAHTLTPTRWDQLGTLRRQTGVRLTLIWHQRPDTQLQERAQRLGTAHQEIHGLDTARVLFRRQGPVRPDPPGNTSSEKHGNGSELQQIEAIQRVAHPLHAGLLAAQTLIPGATAGQLAAIRLADLAPDATALALPHLPCRPTSHHQWHTVPGWAQPLLIAARAWHYLNGHRHSSRHLFQHINFHHHNQLTHTAAALGMNAAIDQLDADPAWPTPTDTH